jgi:hypothetical protein
VVTLSQHINNTKIQGGGGQVKVSADDLHWHTSPCVLNIGLPSVLMYLF